jgi:hypothetical protein
MTPSSSERERERERSMVLKEGANGQGVCHILSFIEWYHIIGIGTNLKLKKHKKSS